MPFDANIPRLGQPLNPDPIRENFNALKGFIDSIPAGPPGPAGQKGDKGDTGDTGSQGPAGPGSSGEGCQIQIADGNGAFASDPTFYFIAGDGYTTLRCNWPTSDPAIPGALWNNNGVLNVSAG